MQENRDLRTARIQVEEVRGRLVQVGLFTNPALESDFSFDSLFTNEDEQTFSAGIFQPFPLRGRIGARKRVASVDIKRTFAELADLGRRLVRDVRRAFIELLAIDEQIKMQDTLISLNSELVKGIKAGIKEGLASEKDLNAVAIALQQARQEKEVLIVQRRSKILELNKLFGKPPIFNFLPHGKLKYEAAKDLTEYGVENAFAKRPDLRFAEYNIELAKADLDLSKALRFEDIEDIIVGVFYQRDHTALDIPEGSISNTDNFIGFKLVIPLPFFDRKQGLIVKAPS